MSGLFLLSLFNHCTNHSAYLVTSAPCTSRATTARQTCLFTHTQAQIRFHNAAQSTVIAGTNADMQQLIAMCSRWFKHLHIHNSESYEFSVWMVQGDCCDIVYMTNAQLDSRHTGIMIMTNVRTIVSEHSVSHDLSCYRLVHTHTVTGTAAFIIAGLSWLIQSSFYSVFLQHSMLSDCCHPDSQS